MRGGAHIEMKVVTFLCIGPIIPCGVRQAYSPVIYGSKQYGVRFLHHLITGGTDVVEPVTAAMHLPR